MEKGMQCGQARVATAGAIPPRLLEMLQKGAEKWRVEIRQAQARRGLVQLLLGKLQEETKGGAVARNRVGTRLPLVHQPLGKICLQEVGKRGLSVHRASPLGRCRGTGLPRGRVPGSRRDTKTCH